MRDVGRVFGAALIAALCSGANCGALIPAPTPGVDGGITIVDGGIPDVIDAGGEGEGEGEGEGDAGVTVFPYTGSAEPGVVCGDTTCALAAPCCATFSGVALVATCADPTTDPLCPGALATLRCDGPEDCTDGLTCCVDLDTLTSSCIAADACAALAQGQAACVNTEECGADATCCSAVPAGPVTLPVDLGACVAGTSCAQ